MLSESQRAAVTARLRRSRSADPAGRIARRPAGLTSPPASILQEQLWFLDQFAPGRSTYNLPCAVRLAGPLDPSALSRAVDGLLARHEVLRTRLVPGELGHPVQVIDPPPAAVTRRHDFRGGGRDAAWQQLRALAADELRRPFQLAHGPLIRAHLAALATGEHVLLLMIHHAVFDGWSAGVLADDLAALYQAEVAGGPAMLAELPVQFGDYAVWERQRLQTSVRAELEGYWRGALDGFEILRMPTDRPRPSVTSFDGGEESRSLPVDLLAGLRELGRREGATLFITLMAAFQALAHRYTGQADVVVGTTTANRSRAVLAPLIGFLVNTLPVRTDLSGDPAFTELLGRTREAIVGAQAHQDLPFAKIVEVLRVERDASRPPVIGVTFGLVDKQAAGRTAAGVTFELVDNLAAASESKFDIELFAHTSDTEFTLVALYASALFDPGTIARLLGNFEVLLRGVVADPSVRLSRLPVLTEAELRHELADWNDSAARFPAICLHEAFAAQVARTPDAAAAEHRGELLSYAALHRQANQVARRLRAAGVGPEVLVGVCLPASLRRLAVLLGILKAGGGYVPLDPALPAERLAFMMADARLAVVIAEDSALARLPDSAAAVLPLAAEWEQIRGLDDSDLDGQGAGPANVAYVIYTSGSTGRPKGVAVEHRQAVCLALGMAETWKTGPQDVVLQFASLSFDVSVLDMFMPLLSGARLLLAGTETLHSPPRLAALLRERDVTFACLPPAVLGLLGDEQFPGLRVLMAAGEELPSDLARRWIRPGLRFVNGYGPTETTVIATYQELDERTQLPPPIGLPQPGYRAYVLDPHLNPVPAGVYGELHIGGAGVARGYLNRPELTKERFIADPFSPEPGARLYKTGDLVRRRPDGAIVFAGRIDNQVKIRGLRIELGEIETALAAHPAVAQAFATVVAGPAGEKQLAAYLRPEPGTGPGSDELRAHLSRTLPGYMIPAYLITVPQFPLNTSGKIDRSALPGPGPAPAGRRHAAPATLTETVLTRLYATVLGRDGLGATDSFFDAGGSSLAVMRLVDLIGQELGADVGVTAIFLHPTPRELAATIDAARSGAGQQAGSGPLVQLSKDAGGLPLYLVHPVGGTVFAYSQLAADLAGAMAVYGLEAPGLTEPGAIAATLADLVSDYTRRILAAQPDGPYHLGGWSMGGVVAFELARRLEQAGQQVSLLVLLDAPYAIAGDTLPGQAQLAGQFLADATRSLGWDAATRPDPAASTAAEQLSWLAERLGDGAADAAVAGRLQRRFDVFQAHVGMLAGYEPADPAVHAPALIVSADGSPNAPARARWPRVLSGPVCTRCVAADHYAFLRPPLVAEVAAWIQQMAGTAR